MASTTVADQPGASVSAPNVASPVAAKPPALGEVDHVASPALGWSDIDELRAKWNVPTRNTVAVAHIDLPSLEELNLEGGGGGHREPIHSGRRGTWFESI
jgi:hypothetical protein